MTTLEDVIISIRQRMRGKQVNHLVSISGLSAPTWRLIRDSDDLSGVKMGTLYKVIQALDVAEGVADCD